MAETLAIHLDSCEKISVNTLHGYVKLVKNQKYKNKIIKKSPMNTYIYIYITIMCT